jgi:transcriptional regulator with XRE-family HTH domain
VINEPISFVSVNEHKVSFPTGGFAGNFDRLLGIHRLSAADASKLLEVSATTLSYWRTGKREPTTNSLARVCDFFEVDMWLLLTAPAGEFVETVLANRKRFELVERRIRGERARGDESPGALRREAETFSSDDGPADDEPREFRKPRPVEDQ